MSDIKLEIYPVREGSQYACRVCGDIKQGRRLYVVQNVTMLFRFCESCAYSLKLALDDLCPWDTVEREAYEYVYADYDPEIIKLLREGKRIAAIKHLRDNSPTTRFVDEYGKERIGYSMTLLEAKHRIDQIMKLLNIGGKYHA